MSTNLKRRIFLKGSLASGVVTAAVGAGLLTPQAVLAAWPKAAFEAKKVDDALSNLLGGSATENSDAIVIKAPDIAENGAVVPVTVSTDMAAESISIIADENPSPLAAAFNLAANAEGYVSTRIKMGKTGNVVAVVKSGGKLYSSTKGVKVTIGGCGG